MRASEGDSLSLGTNWGPWWLGLRNHHQIWLKGDIYGGEGVIFGILHSGSTHWNWADHIQILFSEWNHLIQFGFICMVLSSTDMIPNQLCRPLLIMLRGDMRRKLLESMGKKHWKESRLRRRKLILLWTAVRGQWSWDTSGTSLNKGRLNKGCAINRGRILQSKKT